MAMTPIPQIPLPPHPSSWNIRLVIDPYGRFSIINEPHTHFFSSSAKNFCPDLTKDEGYISDISSLFSAFTKYVATNPTPPFLLPPPGTAPAPTVEARLDNHETRISTLETKSTFPPDNFSPNITPNPYKLHSPSDFNGGGTFNVPGDPANPHDPNEEFCFEVCARDSSVYLYFHSIPPAARSSRSSFAPPFEASNGISIFSRSYPSLYSDLVYLPGTLKERDHEVTRLYCSSDEEAEKKADRIFFALSEYAIHLRNKELTSLREQIRRHKLIETDLKDTLTKIHILSNIF